MEEENRQAVHSTKKKAEVTVGAAASTVRWSATSWQRRRWKWKIQAIPAPSCPRLCCFSIIDDSIVRGTTLKESILRILDRLHPKKIVVVSSAPQIRYPDYYGIDMARLEEFCVFRAAIQLLKERKMENIIEETYQACKAELEKPKEEQMNPVRAIYEPFTIEEINEKIVEMLRPEGMETPIQLVFQSIEGLREAIPNHKGDWYFTGHYPTPGGTKLCNQSFVNYYEKNF